MLISGAMEQSWHLTKKTNLELVMPVIIVVQLLIDSSEKKGSVTGSLSVIPFTAAFCPSPQLYMVLGDTNKQESNRLTKRVTL